MLLNQFFAYAQQNLPPGHESSGQRRETSYLSPESGGIVSGPSLADPSPVSIVNLLSNQEALEPPSRPKTPPYVTEYEHGVSRSPSVLPSRTRSGNHLEGNNHDVRALAPQSTATGETASNSRSSAHLAAKEKPVSESPLQAAKKRLEREYVRIFMNNLHHIHPMVDPIAFAARCEEVIWDAPTPLERNKDLRHFFALYNIVVAVGALIADSSTAQNFEQEINICMKQPTQGENSSVPLSSRTLSKQYFRKSRALLGDIFEVCSLESAQTLLLMVSCLVSICPRVVSC